MNTQAIKPTRLRCLARASLHHSAAQDPALRFELYEAWRESWPQCVTSSDLLPGIPSTW
jgi:hypothetical protein